MLIRTHLIIGLFFGLLILNFVSFENSFEVGIFLILVCFFSIIPDIDTPCSRVGKNILLRPLQFFSGHRKVFHSLLFVLVLGLLIDMFSSLVAWGFVLGYGLHILADSFTIQGVSLFYPFRRIFRGWIKTGGKSDLFVFIIFLILNLIVVGNMFFSI